MLIVNWLMYYRTDNPSRRRGFKESRSDNEVIHGLIFPWNMFFNVLGTESIGVPLSLEKTCP